MSLLNVRGLEARYPSGTHALRGVSFSVETGEFVAVIGLSGSGKSTLLRCLNRIVEPTGGAIEFQGADITQLKGEALRRVRGRIGMIFQQFNLVPRRSVLSNVLMGGLASLGSFRAILEEFPEEMYGEARRCLSVVGMANKESTRADALSGGQQQRVAIARSLMQHPLLLLADEPVASLDPATAASIMATFIDINSRFGTTIICSLHQLSLVRSYASRVVALKQGAVAFDGRPEQLNDEQYRAIYEEEYFCAGETSPAPAFRKRPS